MLPVNYIHFLITGLIALFGSLSAQKDAEALYEGNDLYYSGKILESVSKYARALELNPENKKANFNLGASLYKNAELLKNGSMSVPSGVDPAKRDSFANLIFDQAAANFAVAANSISDKDTLHRAWHNIGNCYLQKKDYHKAVDAFKKSLKYDPKDEETRYNLAFALKNLPKDKKDGGGGNNQPQEQPQKKEEKGQDKQQQPQQSQMNKEQAEQLLQALMNSEKKLQDKRKQKQQDASQSTDKDW
jgi:Ca-activated chloride channel homolog